MVESLFSKYEKIFLQTEGLKKTLHAVLLRFRKEEVPFEQETKPAAEKHLSKKIFGITHELKSSKFSWLYVFSSLGNTHFRRIQYEASNRFDDSSSTWKGKSTGSFFFLVGR